MPQVVGVVLAALERAGWQRIARDGTDEQVFQREDRILRLSAASDGKATDVRITLPSPDGAALGPLGTRLGTGLDTAVRRTAAALQQRGNS